AKGSRTDTERPPWPSSVTGASGEAGRVLRPFSVAAVSPSREVSTPGWRFSSTSGAAASRALPASVLRSGVSADAGAASSEARSTEAATALPELIRKRRFLTEVLSGNGERVNEAVTGSAASRDEYRRCPNRRSFLSERYILLAMQGQGPGICGSSTGACGR